MPVPVYCFVGTQPAHGNAGPDDLGCQACVIGQDPGPALVYLQRFLHLLALCVPLSENQVGCRGTRLFTEPDHDISALRDSLGTIPVAGFFAV